MRSIKILGAIKIFNNAKELDINLEVNYEDVIKLSMELQLLEYELSDEIKIKSQKSSEFLFIKMCSINKYSEYIIDNKNIKLVFSLNELQSISSFLLQYFKNNIAPVSHMHIYLRNKDDNEKEATLSITTDKYLPGYSAEEARLLLKDD